MRLRADTHNIAPPARANTGSSGHNTPARPLAVSRNSRSVFQADTVLITMANAQRQAQGAAAIGCQYLRILCFRLRHEFYLLISDCYGLVAAISAA